MIPAHAVPAKNINNVMEDLNRFKMTDDLKKYVHAVAGILMRNNKILIAERPVGKPYAGYWEFPGGKVEKNETSYQALQRELHEELAIDLLAAKQLLTHTHTYPDKTVNLDVWLVENFRGEPHPKEQQILQWTSLGELTTFHLLEGNWAMVDKIKQLLG